MPKEKAPPPAKKKLPLYIPVLLLSGLLLIGIFYFRFTVLIVPKIPAQENNLLSSRMLGSVTFSQKKAKTQFSQGVLYLSLDPDKKQVITLNVKKPIDLENNDLFLHLALVNPAVNADDLQGTVTVKDNKYFSNAGSPENFSLKPEFIIKDNTAHYLIPIKNEKSKALQINFAEIVQLRLGFQNLKDTPVSLLIHEITLEKKEDG